MCIYVCVCLSVCVCVFVCVNMYSPQSARQVREGMYDRTGMTVTAGTSGISNIRS